MGSVYNMPEFCNTDATSVHMYASTHSVNLMRHLKPHIGEKSQKDFLAVQISIPAVDKCLASIRGDSKTQASPEKHWAGCEIEFKPENILGLHKFWKPKSDNT